MPWFAPAKNLSSNCRCPWHEGVQWTPWCLQRVICNVWALILGLLLMPCFGGVYTCKLPQTSSAPARQARTGEDAWLGSTAAMRGPHSRCRCKSRTTRDLAVEQRMSPPVAAKPSTSAWEAAVQESSGGRKSLLMKKTPCLEGIQCEKQREDSPGLGLPCPSHCFCTATVVNCSGAGLLNIPATGSCPFSTLHLDLSYNRLSELRRKDLNGLSNLLSLDLSHNSIHTIEEGTFYQLHHLQSLKLGFNNLVCDCSVRWLLGWIRERGAIVKDQEFLHCIRPLRANGVHDSRIEFLKADFTDQPCADEFISCVADPERIKDAVLYYSYLTPTLHTRSSCHTLCFQKDFSHYAQDSEDRCLCGSLTRKTVVLPEPPVKETACAAVCSNAVQTSVCNKTIIHAVYPVQASLLFYAQEYYSLHQLIEFTAETSLSVTQLQWDFGDGAELLNTSIARAQHKYSIPGIYTVSLWAQVGVKLLLRTLTLTVSVPLGWVQLECPRVVETGHSIDIWIQTQMGTDLTVLWKMKTPGRQETLDKSSCPRGGRIYMGNLNCYWLSQNKESWQDARQVCQRSSGDDLAVVKTQDVQTFLQEAFSSAGGFAWIGLSDLSSSGTWQWVDGNVLDSWQNWGASGRPEGKGNCAQLQISLRGMWRRSPCNEKLAFICERRAGAVLPDVDLFLTGVPVFTGTYNVMNASVMPPFLPSSSENVELMLFPGLWFSHAGTLISAEFGIKAVKKLLQMRLQVFRPYCSPSQHLVPPGCEFLRTPFASCHPWPLCNTTGVCSGGQQWCSLRESCLNVSSPCSSYAFEHVTSNILPIANPPRYKGDLPSYSQVADVPLILTPSPENWHVQVLLSGEEISVYPDDIVGIQHNGEQGSVLHCQRSRDSPWRQSYVSLVKVGWWEKEITGLANPTWVDNALCDLRVSFAYGLRSFATSPLLESQSEPGSYTYTATVRNAVSEARVNCTVEMQTRISGLQIIYPTPINGKLHVPTHQETLIVIKIISGTNAMVRWTEPVDRTGVQFQSSCPSSIVKEVPACRRDTADTWFSFAWVFMTEVKAELLNIMVANEISSQNLSVKIQSYDAIEDLQVVPSGPRRMLVDVSQVFSAELSKGTSVSYSWIIDDMDVFAYNGQTYSVKFNKPGFYVLKLRAENPVSFKTVKLELTADIMNPLMDPKFLGIIWIVPVHTPQVLTFGVTVDTSIEVTIRWDFGDGSAVVERPLSPPYNQELAQPLPSCKQVHVQSRVTHAYTQPGDYTLTAEAFNQYDKVQQMSHVCAISPLISLALLATPSSALVNTTILFEAYPRPSPYGSTYLWNFNDGFPVQEGTNTVMHYSFGKTGMYNVTVSANNSLSEVTTYLPVVVGEGIVGLQLSASGLSELGSPTVVSATLQSGTNVLWTFDMGDGSVYHNLSAGSVSHIFAKEGNYTITVTAKNIFTSTCRSITVEVYQFQITALLAPGFLLSREIALFQAFVTGPVKGIHFSWNFSDGDSPSVLEGDSRIRHSYSKAGNYLLNLTAFTAISTDSHQSIVVVEDRILSVKLAASAQAVALGETIRFTSEVIPAPDPQHQYRYYWDFGINEPPVPSSTPEITFIYLEEGVYEVTVQTQNNVDRQNASMKIIIQRGVGTITIHHSGETGQVLASNISYVFTAEVSTAANSSFTWNFGDFSPLQEGQSASHTYGTMGNFTISVSGENLVSCRTAMVNVTVLTPVKSLSLSSDHLVEEVGQEVTFWTSVATGDRVRYHWAVCEFCDFREGISSLKHTFFITGVTMVLVIAENTVSTQKANISVVIQEKVQGVQIHSQDTVRGRYAAAEEPFVLTTDVVRGSNVTFKWVISQGLSQLFSAEGPSLTYCYNTSGELLVVVTAGNLLGNMSERLVLQVMERVDGVQVQSTTSSAAVGSPVNLTVSVASGTDLQYAFYIDEEPQALHSNDSSLSYTYWSPGSKIIVVMVSNFMGSSNGSTELRVQEPVSGVSFSITGIGQPSFLKSNTTVQFQGSVEKGTDVQWEWCFQSEKETLLFQQQNISCALQEVAVYRVVLRAWNHVSKDVFEHTVTVQEAVLGLEVEVNHKNICTDDMANFRFQVQRGTNLMFALTFTTLGLTLDTLKSNYNFSFPVAGQHRVLVSAYNNVSLQTASVTVHVLEKVKGLNLINCCPPILEFREKMPFSAAVQAGGQVSFSWTFHLHGHLDHRAMGQQVWYSPPTEGNLTVQVFARNLYCLASLIKTVILQVPVTTATLSSNGTNAFINQTIGFHAVIQYGSDLHFQWKFGDSNKTFENRDVTAAHRYKQPGDFIAEVKVYNNISFVLVQATVTVRELQCNAPYVDLVEAPSVIPKSQASYFEASVDLQGCTAYRAQYLWKVFRGTSCQHINHTNQVPLGSVDVVTPLLVLPRLSLDVGAYCLCFTASFHDTPLLHTASLYITVVQSKLVPMIRGGSQRNWSAEQDLVLDGSRSYDPDVGTTDGNVTLEYHWDWIIQSALSPSCSSYLPPLKSIANITIPRSMLCSGATYEFTLTVRHARKEPVSVTQTVWIRSGQILPVTLECRSCCALSSYQVSRSIHVTVSGQCETCDNSTQYKWTVQSSDGQLLPLDNATTSTGALNRDLVIRQGILRDGINYTFTVTAFQPSGELWGGSSITLTPNKPPNGGVCTLQPEGNIYLLETFVSYQCTGWVDEDRNQGQLIYTLLVQTCSHDGQSCQQFCLYHGTKSSFSTLLPVGSGGNQSMVDISVELEDLQGAKTLALKRTLTIHMPELPPEFQSVTSWLKNKSQSELWGLVQQGNPLEVIPYSVALISTLNQDSEVSRSNSWKDLEDRMSIRSNITVALTSLKIASVKDVTQLSAALAQCVVSPEELTLDSHARILETVQRMIHIIGTETEEGHNTPTSAGRSILGILGRTLSTLDTVPSRRAFALGSSGAAVSTFNLTRALMKSLMRSRVLNEETLSLSVSEIQVQGKRVDSRSLMCTEASDRHCLFSLPTALSAQLAGKGELVQVMMDIGMNPFPFHYMSNNSISTHLASLEFTASDGTQIPISNLSEEKSIRLRLPVEDQESWNASETLIHIPPGDSVNFMVKTTRHNEAVRTHIHIHVTVPVGFDLALERKPMVSLNAHESLMPNVPHSLWRQDVTFASGISGSSKELTILIPPPFNGTFKDYHVKITSHFLYAPVNASVSVFTSLCQYFHFQSMQWSTEGITPTNATNHKEVVCLTEHLTVFGASLFVPLRSVIFLPPSEHSKQSPLMVITCSMLFSIYLVMVLIAHKLDDIDITRVGIIPLCGPPGRYKYWVIVKTGWKGGSGTTAHVGISLYGLNRSGSRHLDKSWAFQRNSQDIFQVETDANLGEIWKIRIWHDNTGMDPSWYLQHVIVWDKQTNIMYFFLVEDWLSVENVKTEGMVEKEVLAACLQELRSFPRVFLAQLLLGFSDWHIWLSVWGRPPHSRFTRVQRITCCIFMLYLFMASCALWYGAVGIKGYSVPIGSQALVTAESIAVGMVVAVVVFPIQLLLTSIFRETQSKVVVEDPDPPAQDAQTVEVDMCLEHSELGSSSFLSIPGGPDSIMDVSSLSCESPVSGRPVTILENTTKLDNESYGKHWLSCDSIFDIPDLLNSDPLVTRSRILKRKKALLKLGMASQSSLNDDPLSFSMGDSAGSRRSSCDHHHLNVSEEHLLKSVVAECGKGEGSDHVTTDSGRFSPSADADLTSDTLESSCSDWSSTVVEQRRSGWGFLHKSFSYISTVTSMGSILLPALEPPSAPASSFSTRIGIPRRPPGWLFPHWMLSVTYSFLFLVLMACFGATVVYGYSLPDSIALMWFISTGFAFLTSFLLLEPLKVLLEALCAALVTKPVESEGEGLVEEPLIKKMPERIGKVRAPCGYGLLQAKEEARKLRALQTLMRNCIVHMLFLLVVLMVNYQGCFHDNNIRLLHTAIRQSITMASGNEMSFTAVQSVDDLWQWMESALLAHLYNNPRTTLVGAPRLRQDCSALDLPLGPSWPEFAFLSVPNFHTNSPCPRCVSQNPPKEIFQTGWKEAEPCFEPSPSNSSQEIGFWFWGKLGLYNSYTGAWQELGNSSGEAQRVLRELRDSYWISKRSKAVFVEFTQYNADVNLYAAVTLLFEFPRAGPAVRTLTVLPFHMLQLSKGLDFPLAMAVCLLIFGVGFLVPQLLLLFRERGLYLKQGRCWIQLLLVLLSVAIGLLHFSCVWMADVKLEKYRQNRQAFTSFYEVVILQQMEIGLSAILLMVTMLRTARQLSFVKRWSVFEKTFRHALVDLFAATCLLFLLILIYAQCGYLMFHATVEEFRTFGCSFFSLLSVLHGKMHFRSLLQHSPILGGTYIFSYVVGLLWIGGRFLCAIILHSYRGARAEMYQPTVEPQDYEMIEFFVKRFKLRLGLSKTKEFRHKVKFEGMESLLSCSSRNSKLSRLPSAGTAFHYSGSTISSGSFCSEELALPDSPAPDSYDVGVYLERLPLAVNNLLDQFDCVNRVLEDVCCLESGLEQIQKKINENKKMQKGRKNPQAEKKAAWIPATQLALARTYSTFSESALFRLRTSRAKVSAVNTMTNQAPVSKSWLSGQSMGAELCQRFSQVPGISWKWRPKSEEGQGCSFRDIPQRHVPPKRRAWQTENTGDM
ncbi:polycystin-1-like [Microcaecilia unicolor]|uniref:Polycystin-1-like n=1 Tax=Microcaecilia unicolor TaxID=1415580 RepID=A0A6P7YGP9_9AMPH|nr:polycystin-1-like [Microcaecilia unicolor]